MTNFKNAVGGNLMNLLDVLAAGNAVCGSFGILFASFALRRALRRMIPGAAHV